MEGFSSTTSNELIENEQINAILPEQMIILRNSQLITTLIRQQRQIMISLEGIKEIINKIQLEFNQFFSGLLRNLPRPKINQMVRQRMKEKTHNVLVKENKTKRIQKEHKMKLRPKKTFSKKNQPKSQ